MLRAEGKDVIRNLKNKSVLICDICGRLISNYRWCLPQIAQMHTDVGAEVSPTDSTDEYGCGIRREKNKQ